MPKHPEYTNRLIKEKSPYLLQHAHNPVDWYSWGEEAFSKARALDKPIFLSIGYATCHWCHVMETECFEDVGVAELMNETFINIKLDREELPEVDSLYMEFAQSMMAGAAGWPLNVIITPDLEPFFAATYLPPQSKHGLMGLTDLILRIREVWNSEDRDRVLMQAEKIVELFSESIHTKGNELPSKDQVEDAAEIIFKLSDPIYGGMRGAPKFPIGYQSNFMLRYSSTHKESRALFIVERTLEMMHRGGIYDHLGGGISRYSVDENWFIPHFEKMLYDNAILAFTYLEAWQATKKPFYRQVCEEIIQYVLRDMSHEAGGFYSAEDADSEGEEGYFYTWTLDEVQQILGKKSSKLFCAYYDITKMGNFENHRNILHTRISLEEFAASLHLNFDEFSSQLLDQKRLLWAAREKRVHPFKDDKILSSWNGLMIHSLAEAGAAFGNEKYCEAAVKTAGFIRLNLWKNNRLLRRWREGEAHYEAGLDEYAFLIRSLISLFEIDQGFEWLEWAIQMSEILQTDFKDKEGAFYQTDGKNPHIILRKCQFSDGAEPSGNAVHCENLQRLYLLTGDLNYLEQAEDIFQGVKKYLDSYSPGYSYHAMNLNRYYDTHAITIVIALNTTEDHREEIFRLIYGSFLPHKSVIWRREGDEKLFKVIPSVEKQIAVNGMTTVYICREGVCQQPLTEMSEIAKALNPT